MGLVVTNDDEGIYYARTMRSELERSGLACLAYVEFMRSEFMWSDVQRVVTTIKESKARVVIYLANYLIAVMEADNAEAQGVRSMLILRFILIMS